MKNGFSTTEFWVTMLILFGCAGLAVFLFYHNTTWADITGVAVVGAGMLKANWYTINRAKLKLQEILKNKDPEPSKPPEPGTTPVEEKPVVTFQVFGDTEVTIRTSDGEVINPVKGAEVVKVRMRNGILYSFKIKHLS